MKLDATTNDLWKLLVKTWIVMGLMVICMVYMFGKFGVFKMEKTVGIHDQNFGTILKWQQNVEGRFQRLELAAQIQGNIVESGELDDQGRPIKK